MKIIKTIMFTLIFGISLPMHGFGINSLIQSIGLAISNWNFIEKIPDFILVNRIDKKISTLQPINDHPLVGPQVKDALKQYEIDENFPVYAVQSPILFDEIEDPQGCILNNKMIINPYAVNSLKPENNNSSRQEATITMMGHEGGHVQSIAKHNSDSVWPLYSLASNFASYKIFNGILKSDRNMFIKCGSIVTIATATYFMNKAYWALDSQKEEKKADLYAMKLAPHPQNLKSFNDHYTERAQLEPKSTYDRLFGSHPPLYQRIKKFEQYAIHREFLEQKHNAPPLSQRAVKSSFEDID